MVAAKVADAAKVWAAIVPASCGIYTTARNTGYTRREARRISCDFIARCTR